MMNADVIVADYYTRLVDRVNASGVGHLSENDRIIWYIVSARCEKDMEGFDSIFIQFASETELPILIEGLNRIDEHELAALFKRAFQALQKAGFYARGTPSYYQLQGELADEIEQLGELIGDRMWGLDEKLVPLIEAD